MERRYSYRILDYFCNVWYLITIVDSILSSLLTLQVTVSYLQIYQEKIFDLLKEGSENVELAIRENPHSGKLF